MPVWSTFTRTTNLWCRFRRLAVSNRRVSTAMNSNGCLRLSGRVFIRTDDSCSRIRVEEADMKRRPTHHELARVAFVSHWCRGICATARGYDLWALLSGSWIHYPLFIIFISWPAGLVVWSCNRIWISRLQLWSHSLCAVPPRWSSTKLIICKARASSSWLKNFEISGTILIRATFVFTVPVTARAFSAWPTLVCTCLN